MEISAFLGEKKSVSELEFQSLGVLLQEVLVDDMKRADLPEHIHPHESKCSIF